ncbi:MarR family transcriptional regulator [Mumia sp. zg.B53]|uniref:MarR family winged helix-turn-helix transcriptional regulator n=1 Tax=Mumia sp. zg.B53 TaxID=2855449 RepID=UPI001C6ED981|nr:MarR family transcriptional regulator [Mumia sp. zg.B53]MBW9215515.1 MarR family transcriptional regulator [Mumia sp. zg.B53]
MTTPESLAGRLEEFFLQAAARCEGDAVDAFAALDLSATQSRTLLMISSRPGTTQISDVARAVGVSVAAAGRAVDQLVGAGLVCRNECADDRRVRLVTLTDRGRELVGRQLQTKRAALQEIARELSEPTRSLLDRALRAALSERQPTTPAKDPHP